MWSVSFNKHGMLSSGDATWIPGSSGSTDNLQWGYGVVGSLLSLKCEQNAIEYIKKGRNNGVLLEGSLRK